MTTQTIINGVDLRQDQQMDKFSAAIVTSAIIFSAVIYCLELADSPLYLPEILEEKKYISSYVNENSPDIQKERKLARAYWRRYNDVRLDQHWGEKGPMGVWGPRDHYMLHGRREGRIFKPLIIPSDMVKERIHAEAYWQRYDDIRTSSAWGEKSELGILGPRDHYTYIGRFEHRQWGATEEKLETEPSRKHIIKSDENDPTGLLE